MATKHTDSCLLKAGDDEPIFVLRAQDRLAPHVVRHWAKLAEASGTPSAKVEEARALAELMTDWAMEHASKTPD